jgi:serine/threonine protein kinase
MLVGTLAEPEQSALTSHLDTCPTCRQTLEDLATDGESWSDMMGRLKNKSVTIEPALEQAIAQIKAAAAKSDGSRPSPGARSSLEFLSPADKPGQLGQLAHYEITEIIGQGGMGIVLKAFDTKLHRVVAMKVLQSNNVEARRRFLREARAAAKVTHDQIVTIHDVNEANGVPYLVMQHITGVSLQQRLDQRGQMDVKDIVRIGQEIARGLAAAHAQGLIHRDIKPANILLENGTERVKITDFGLARAVDDVALTQSGVLAGTPLYMAPEQARGEPLDPRADLFSLGSVLYVMCTGRAPFRAENSMAVLRKVTDDTPRPITDINPKIPDWLVAIIAKLHAKDPTRRYQAAAEVAEMLKGHLGEIQNPATAPLSREANRRTIPQSGRRRRIRIIGVAAAVVLLAIGFPLGGYWYTDWKVKNLDARLRTFPVEMQSRLRAFTHEERDKTMVVSVTGPSTFQVGAANEYVIETKNLDSKLIPAMLALRVRDESKKDRPVLIERTGLESNGEYRFTAPSDVGFKGGGELSLEITAEGQGTSQSARFSEKLALLGAAYITHVTTDKPMYKPGEVVGFRSLTLDSFSRRPAEEDLRLIFTITNPQGQEIFKIEGPALLAKRVSSEKLLEGPDGKPIRGVGAGDFPIPDNAPGGEYTLTVREAQNRFAPQERRFLVNRYEKPRLNKELEFTRKSYGPGDEVVAAAKASRIEGGVALAGRPVWASVQVDGKHYNAEGQEVPSAHLALMTDSEGAVNVRFHLPKTISKGEASLSLQFTDGGNVETLVRSIPIVMKKLQIDFYPEGGDLVAGVPNRVYFQARTTLDRPADLSGRIVDDKGAMAAVIYTLHMDKVSGVNHGLGLFEFVPAKGIKYELKIDSPSGVEGNYVLPEVKEDGVALKVLAIGGNHRPVDSPIRVQAWSPRQDRELLAGIFYHGRLLSHETKQVKAGNNVEWSFQPPGPGGVYRVTIFELRPQSEPGASAKGMMPVAERLIYHQPPHHLNLAVKPDKEVYVPGEKVKLNLKASDETGKSAPSVMLVGVVNQGVMSLADEKTYHSMPAHFYMTSEIYHPEDLENADFLLSDLPVAEVAIDYLLGTQGWRRFAETKLDRRQEQEQKDTERLFASLGQTPVRTSNLPEVEKTFLPQLQKDIQRKSTELIQEEREMQMERISARDRLQNYEVVGQMFAYLVGGFICLGMVVGSLALLVIVVKKHQQTANAMVLIAVAGCMILVVGLIVINMLGKPATSTFEIVGSAIGEAGQKDKAVMRNEMAKTEGPHAPMAQAPPPRAMQKGEPVMEKGVAPSPPPTPAPPEEQIAFREPNQRPGQEIQLYPDEKEGLAYRDTRFELAGKFLSDRAGALASKPLPPVQPRSFWKASTASESSEFSIGGPLLVREYTHRRSDMKGHLRTDFTETVYWNPVLVLTDGEAFCDFDLSDSVTSYQIRAMGHTLDGRLGEMTTLIRARKPFTVEPKIPIEITNNDKIDLPITVSNDTAGNRDVKVRLQAKYLDLAGAKAENDLHLEANERRRLVYRLQPTTIEGEATLHVAGESEPFAADRVLRSIKIVPEGFPIAGSSSDVIDQVVRHDLRLPQTWVPGTLKLQVQAFPSLLADLQTGLDSMLQEPHGCFEQASSSNYPNLLILNYLTENNLAKPQVALRAQQLLASGYQKLVAFECTKPNSPFPRKKADGGLGQLPREGYEWFGGAVPPHEALTAYGLLEFRDMSRVFEVDKSMVDRTRNFLMGQRDGMGGFNRNPRSLDQFGRAATPVTNAYIVWALTESGKEDDLSRELTALSEQAKTSKDPYFLALVANSLLNRDKKDECTSILQSLAGMQDKDGFVAGGQTSITGSRGRDLQIEATSLAILAWTKANPPKRMEKYRSNLQSAIKWLGQQRGPVGGFGATQATILALKALTALSQTTKTNEGELILHVGSDQVASRKFAAGAQEALTLDLPDPDHHLKPGVNKLRIEMKGDNEFPYTLSWSYRTLTPPSAEKCPVKLTTHLDKTDLREGETTRLSAVLENKEDQGQGMAVAIIGLPAGLNLPEDLKQIKELTRLRNDETEPGIISAWEIHGRELILYWRELAPRQKIEVNLDLICRVPGEYRGPASRAYLYYNADDKCWVEPLKATIKPQ